MIKQLIIWLLLIFSFFIWNQALALTEQEKILNDQWWNNQDSNYTPPKTHNAETDMTKSSFMIDTWNFSPWWQNLKQWNSKDTINNTLWTFMQKAMILLWIASLFIMIIWAWYMILHHWEDEYLSKWKSIFTWWIVSLIVALSAYYLVNIIWYILYSK